MSTSVMEDVILKYKPLTSETRVEDFELPQLITLGGMLVSIPESMLRKDVHYLISNENKMVRAAWISKPFAHVLNSYRFENNGIRYRELARGLEALDSSISELIKYGVLKDKHGPGAMAFCQAHEAVPKDSILISSRTFDTLCAKNPKWKTTKTVMAVRFPNLGPGTTQELKLVVNKPRPMDLLELKDTSIGSRVPGLRDLLATLEEEAEIIDTSGIIDAFYIHPETLKECFEGDGDGDQIFIVIEKRGLPRFKKLELTRKAAQIPDSQIDVLFSKSQRVDRENLADWLPNYFDDVPIGQATYAIRWMLYNRLKKYKGTDHPMAEAWKELAPDAIKLVEFVMDVRKGDFTDEQIDQKMTNIQNKMAEIKKAKQEGDWFAKTVTSGMIEDIPNFVTDFPSLQNYVDIITGQKTWSVNFLERGF